MLTEQEAKDFMSSTLPQRFHKFWLEEMGNEDDFQEMMRYNKYNYLLILADIKQKMPVEFYAYFHDLLCDEEKDKYEQAFLNALQGKISSDDE